MPTSNLRITQSFSCGADEAGVRCSCGERLLLAGYGFVSRARYDLNAQCSATGEKVIFSSAQILSPDHPTPGYEVPTFSA